MAEQVSQIKVEIDTEEAQAKLDKLYETQARLVEEMSKVDEGSEAYKELGDALEETNKQIGSIESNVKKQTMSINDLDDITHAASITVTNLGLSETALGKIINSVAGVIGKMKSATVAYTKAQKAANIAVNTGTKSVTKLNKAMKGNIIIMVVSVLLPLISSLIDKIKEAGNDVLTLEDKIDRINTRYERMQNTLSKLGADEIIALSVEQRRLTEEINTTRAEYARMRDEGEKITKKMKDNLKKLDDAYVENQRQIKYLQEDIAKTNRLLEQQAELDKKLAENTKVLNAAQARLEIEKERNGYSKEYFDILKNISALEETGRRLQEEALENQKTVLDEELATYSKRIKETKGLTGEEKKQTIANKEKSISIEKQKIDNQKITIDMERQLSFLQKQKSTIAEIKRIEEENVRLMIQMNESSAKVYASNVRNQADMEAIWANQNKQMGLIRDGMEDWRKTMIATTGDKTVDEFLNKWYELREAFKDLPEDSSRWSAKNKKVFEEYQRYSYLSSQYATKMNQLITDLESNINTTVEAQTKALGAMYQFAVVGAEDATTKQFNAFKENLENIEILYKVLVNEYNKIGSDDGLMSKFTDLLNTQEGFKDLYLTFQSAGLQGIKSLEDYLDTLKAEYINVYNEVNNYTLESMRSTTEYFSAAMMVGLASYRDYVESYDDYLYNQAELQKQNLELQTEQMRRAGVDEVAIAEWVKAEKIRIDNEYNVERKQLYQNANLEMLSQGTSFVNNMSDMFSNLYEDNKDIQKATIVVNTLANAAMAFGSTFAQAAGGLAAKAAQAAAASAAVLASGIKAYRNVDSAGKGTTLSGGGSSSSAPQTGTSSVSSTIIERQIQPVNVRSTTETVLVLSDVEAKQRQQQNVNKVSVV